MKTKALNFKNPPCLACWTLAVLLAAGGSAEAATVSSTGYTNGFGTQPPATDWATLNIVGSGRDTYDSDMDVIASITAGDVAAQTALDAGNPPAANANAVWSSSGLYLQTRPTGNRATVLMGKFVNNTGTNATQIALSYTFTVAAGGTTEDLGKGTRVYFSVTGAANSWLNIAALNTTASANGSSTAAANFFLNWTNEGELFLLWLDDNSSGGTDSANQFDNFSLRVTAGTPTNFFCSVSAPTNNAAVPAGASFSVTAIAINGTGPYTVDYFTNSGAGDTLFASAGSSGTAPYPVSLGPLPIGTYGIYAVATDNAGLSTNSVTNTFSVVNPLAFALTAPLDGAIFEHTTPVSATATVSGGTAPYRVQFYLDDVPSGAVLALPPYERNFGILFAGDHTIRATVTDAKGWVRNSLVSTIHIEGPLAAILTPTNGASFGYGTAFSLSAKLGGGTAPYAASFHVNGQLAGTLAAPPFTQNLGVLPAGSYTCYVHATDSSLPTAQQADSGTNVITIIPPPLRIMPLGDSITLGLSVPGGYRAPLYQLLTNAGRQVDFIGTQTGNGAASLPDPDHEGYSGYTIRDIDFTLPSIFSASVGPDIILMLLGVNDYRISDDIGNATNRLEALIVRLATNWPGAKIVVANLLPTSEPLNTQIQTTFNPLLPGLCERQRALGRQVYFNDLRSVIQLADLPDQLHPNQFGYNKMATNWLAAINALPCAGCPPRFTLQPRGRSMLPGTNVSLVAAAIGAGDPIRYQWRFEGMDILNATNAAFGFTNASISHQGNYTVAATDTNGTTVSSNAFLYLNVIPVFVLNPRPQTVLQGGTATFTAIATGAPPIGYRWQRSGTYITTNDTGVLVLTNVQASHTIRVAATNFAIGPGGVVMTPPVGVALTMLPDFDHDGMADAWETQYGFDTNNPADAMWDFDGDTMINRDEYIAGTNPTNASSLLKLTLNTTNSGVLEFLAESNIAYTVQYRTNLSAAPWSNLTNISAQSQARTVQVNVPNPPATRERYYRVVTPPVP
jgi:lysophospholipase L1-like esterase